MKLRNKKTGDIVQNFDGFTTFTNDWSSAKNLQYTSLTKLNEEWEDYTPAEPLIKDEKVRKAVRAWASSNEVKEVLFDKYWHSFRDVDMVISFLFSYGDFDCLEDGKTYTIAELCGEEEE
jgi:hypothetical protein